VRVHAVAGPKDARLSVKLAYDAIAAAYDEQVRGDDWMRRALHAHYARVFRPGQYVLDVGCGTGIDALFLAGLGVNVLGIDASAEMIDRARTRFSHAGLGGLVAAQVLEIESLGQLHAEGPFDGIISAFASLSSLPDLASFARDAAGLVRAGGRLILHLLNRFSSWEWLGYVAHRDWRSARAVGHQTKRDFVIGGQAVTHLLYFADQAYARFFRPDFVLRDAYSLGALRPPHTVKRIARPIVGALQQLDLRTGRLPLLRDAGRFFVLDLERRRSA
jgi:2-polyprenyl-3-methyl-5-hydroxy-6-metoxy-1,4-benzoquinol methylase